MNVNYFKNTPFLPALKALFKDLKVPMNYVADEPTTAKEILKDTYKETHTFQLMDDVYFVGMVDDAAFEENKSLEAEKIKSDYDGILVFGVMLKERPNGLLPTRSQLAEISRAFNREFYYTPVVVVFKYGNHLAFANTERLKYKQEWREGEKAGKVSLLRDIKIDDPHSGHERILAELQIPTTGSKKVDSFAKLYAYWQEVFSVSLLNKKFYQELSNWYFWATKHVTFPGEPTIADAHHKNANLDDLLQEHRATNVIRMLTRLLFVWFIKEKKLIPEDLFELDALQKEILNEISPYHEKGMFKERNKESVYYKAILQNLFFATLNCPIEGDSLDKRKRGFRGDGYGTHRGIDYLMRYKPHFKNPDVFLEKLNDVVPFLNGGLFECLDDKFNNTYIDGFSDQMTKGEQLIVPDYLFFGVEEETDLSDVVGISDKKYKQAAVKGLINILKSYKFTITENTPIEEDVALDPELLGKVFENLLASYNPETKTTARKQTGSFYTPREIVNYMVDESLIAYLKNAITDWGGLDDDSLDKELHVLTSFDLKVPFADKPDLQKQIITALSTCTILDPACGSGAFPMGILQKMVHILQKLDPDNKVWKEVQLGKAEQDSKAAFEIEDKQAREARLLEINEAFDQSINDPDYARKLFLIENCIYGVDIQPIATQISKLRFFISLVVEQKVNPEKDNFGIRPLPNLETKFVAANTLIGIEKPNAQLSLYDTKEVKALELKLKKVRSKLFSAKSKDTKLKYREEDKVLRNQIASELEKSGWKSDTAQKLAGWDPYDQNASSPFFDPEWMFDIKDGFDVVIGNPPYVDLKSLPNEVVRQIFKNFKTAQNRVNLYSTFIEKGIALLNTHGVLTYINPNSMLVNDSYEKLRELLLPGVEKIVKLPDSVFENATVETIILISRIVSKNHLVEGSYFSNDSLINFESIQFENFSRNVWAKSDGKKFNIFGNNELDVILEHIESIGEPLLKYFDSSLGITPYDKYKGHSQELIKNRQFHSTKKETESYVPLISGRNITRYFVDNSYSEFLNYGSWLGAARSQRFFLDEKIVVRQIVAGNDLRLVASYSNEPHYFTQIGFSLVPKKRNSKLLKATLAIINSTLLSFYHKHRFLDIEKIVFQKVLIANCKKLPIRFNYKESLLCFLVDVIVKNGQDSSFFFTFDSVLDALVFNLYFPDHMKERGIDVLEFVERDINEVMQGREYEKLSDTDKEHVIEQLHAKWNHPDNEVRNRIKLFAVRSPEILKPILES